MFGSIRARERVDYTLHLRFENRGTACHSLLRNAKHPPRVSVPPYTFEALTGPLWVHILTVYFLHYRFIDIPNDARLGAMLGMQSFGSGAVAGVTLGLSLGLMNVITHQVFGTGWIDWAASKAGGA